MFSPAAGTNPSPAEGIRSRVGWAPRAPRPRAGPRTQTPLGSPHPSELTFLFPQKSHRHRAGGPGDYCFQQTLLSPTSHPHAHPAGTALLPSISSGRAGIPRPPPRAAAGTPAPGRPAPATSPLPGPGIARSSPPPLAPRGAGAHPRVPGPGRMGPSAGGAAEAGQDTAPAPASGNGRRGSDRRYRAGRSWGRCPGEAPAPRRREGRDGGRERWCFVPPVYTIRSIRGPPEPLGQSSA